MDKRIVFYVFLSMFLLSAMLGMHFSRPATANPIPFPVIWMPEEYINATISPIDGVLWARVNGTYPFENWGYDNVTMYYPVPSGAYNISVKMNETSLDWSYSDKNYSTVIDDFSMVNWTICPAPVYFAIRTYYEHPVPLINGNYTFLYAMGTGRYLETWAKETTAYVTVSISKDVAYTEGDINVYRIGYNTTTEEWIWKPANYTITQEDETWIVTLTVVSEFLGSLKEDLLITIKKTLSISTPYQQPEMVMPNQNVTVLVNVTDAEGGVRNVTLCYSTDGGSTWTNVPMDKMVELPGPEDTYMGEIPGFHAGTNVWYKIIAYDNAGNVAVNSNAGQYYLYVVVPEFPKGLSILLVFVTLTIAITIYKRKLPSKSFH